MLLHVVSMTLVRIRLLELDVAPTAVLVLLRKPLEEVVLASYLLRYTGLVCAGKHVVLRKEGTLRLQGREHVQRPGTIGLCATIDLQVQPITIQCFLQGFADNVVSGRTGARRQPDLAEHGHPDLLGSHQLHQLTGNVLRERRQVDAVPDHGLVEVFSVADVPLDTE